MRFSALCVLDFDNLPYPPAAYPAYHQILSRKGERPMTLSVILHGLIRKGELVPVQKGERWIEGVGNIASAMLSIIWKGAVVASSLLWKSSDGHNNASRFVVFVILV